MVGPHQDIGGHLNRLLDDETKVLQRAPFSGCVGLRFEYRSCSPDAHGHGETHVVIRCLRLADLVPEFGKSGACFLLAKPDNFDGQQTRSRP